MKFGLIGHPVGHSFSKMIHKMLGNDDYEIVDLTEDEVCPFLQSKDFIGLNVTLPYKEKVIPFLDKLDEKAREIGAVNTIINENAGLVGYNTDYYGFLELLKRHVDKEELKGQKAVIFGTGGTSKTVAAVLKDLGVANIYKVSRKPVGEDILSMEEASKLGAEILINTTPVGMYPQGGHCIIEQYRDAFYKNAKLCIDVVYRPIETEFVKEAKKRGIKAEGGLYMLVGQAVGAAEHFMKKQFSDTMMDEVFEKMGQFLEEGMVIEPSLHLSGKIDVPPSKSYSHRHLIMAALSGKEAVLLGVGKSKDIETTLDALENMGAEIEVLCANAKERDILIDGRNFLKKIRDREIYCNESGSSLRFLLPLAFLSGEKFVFYGEESLMNRPMWVYDEICKEQGIFYEKKDGKITVAGKLKSGKFEFAGDVSSQFVTGLLFVLPFLKGDSEISLIPPVESLPYIDMTIQTLLEWGVKVLRKDNNIYVTGGQQIRGAEAFVEKDYSNAAYLYAYNWIGNRLEFGNIGKASLDKSVQGDRAFVNIFDILATESHPTIDMSQTPDLVPIAMALAAFFSGAVFTGTKRLAIKESNRGYVMAKEMEKFGVRVMVHEDSIEVNGTEQIQEDEGRVANRGCVKKPTEWVFGHNDHRIVMALTFMLSAVGGELKGFLAVEKSFPTYFEDLKACGLKIRND